MKKLFLILLAAIPSLVNGQAILRVNNTPGINAPYTTIAAAVAAAGVNDIIMVEGSQFNYGDITINKKVTIVGPGYLLEENTALQANLLPAMFATITLNSGASGSVFSGLWFRYTLNFIVNSVSNLSIENCYFEGCNGSGGGGIQLDGTGSNVLIKGNYFTKGCFGFLINSGAIYSSVIVTNNLLRGTYTGALSQCSFSNNIFFETPELQYSIVSNNIFLISPGISNTTGSTVKNNIFIAASQVGADATNAFSVNPSSLFIGLTGNTTDTQWKLKAGSPAIGFGIGGFDCGMYGGADPYRPSGITAGQPTIFNFTAPTTVTQSGTLNVKVSAKVN